MSDQHAQKNPAAAAADSVREYGDRAGRWAGTYLPGGQRTFWIILALLAVIGLLWLIKPATNTQTGISRYGNAPMPVGVGHVRSGDVNVTLDALGTVTPLATVTVHPELTGQLMKIDFQEGQIVKAGDKLAEIDPRPYEAALGQAKGQLARDQATLDNAKVDLARYVKLNKENAIAEQIYATQVAAVRTDTGTVIADKAAVKAAEVNLVYCNITSPVSGRVGIRQVDVGNLVQSGGASTIVVVTQLQPMSVLFTIPEDSVPDVVDQLRTGKTLSVEAYDRSMTTKLATGTVAVIDNQVNATTGTVQLRAIFDNSHNELFPQQFVNMRLLVNTLRNQTTAPVAAIQRGAQGSYVYVVNPKDSTVNMQTVTLGPTDGSKVAIDSGLTPGQEVVTDGADRLRDGATVLLPGAKPPVIAADGSVSGGGATAHKWNGKRGQGRHHHHHSDQSGSGSGGGP